jgi:hypothetical protein
MMRAAATGDLDDDNFLALYWPPVITVLPSLPIIIFSIIPYIFSPNNFLILHR